MHFSSPRADTGQPTMSAVWRVSRAIRGGRLASSSPAPLRLVVRLAFASASPVDRARSTLASRRAGPDASRVASPRWSIGIAPLLVAIM